MRIVFMGTSPFAVPSLEALVNAGHEIAAVVTQPDRPGGRGRSMRMSPVKQIALTLGLQVFQPERIREQNSIDHIKSFEPLDAIVVAAFGQIIPQAILNIPEYGSINVHASLLPRYRGAAPIQYAIMCGETKTGVTTMLMDAGLDTGDILLMRETEIGRDETAGDLEPRLAKIGAELLILTLDKLERGEIAPQPQDPSQATVARSIKREEGRIDWNRPAKNIQNLVRAFTPRPGAFTILNSAQIKVHKTEVIDKITEGKAPGEVVDITKDEIVVAAGEGGVKLIEVQPENRQKMSAGAFARGSRLNLGTLFASS
ncbi:MAG: methionyl-tRNA formyltransferase [Armatimonadota bacterium]